MAKTNRMLTYQGDTLVHDSFDDVSIADGAYSWQFDGNTQQINVPHHSSLAFSNGDWTIEFWALPTATDNLVGGRNVFAKRATSANYASLLIGHNGSTGYWEVYISNSGGTSPWFVISTTNIKADTGVWQHIAIVRRGVNIYAYKDGIRTTLTSSMSTNAIFDNGYSTAIIGGLPAESPVSATTSYGASRYRGYLSNFRITKGVALYTDATVIVPTSPLISQGTVTSLLICQSATFKDNSSFAHDIYDTNTPVISYKNPFTPEKSVRFDGSSQYLSLTDNAAFQYGTGNFTIEAWVYLSSSTFPSTQKRFWSQQNTGASTVCWVGVTNALKFSSEIRSSTGTLDTQISGTTTVQLNTWYHVAFVRTGTTTYLFVNGVQEATATSQSQNLGASVINVGSYNVGPADYWSGLISNLRVMKGVAVYTSNFAPPTQPLSAAGASLLTCTSRATLKDYSTNNFAITATGRPRVSDLNPFEASILTDESSVPVDQRLTNSVSFGSTARSSLSPGTSTNLALGAGNFTIELWVYPTAWNSSTSIIWDYRTNGSAATSIPALAFSTTGVPLFYVSPGSTETILSNTAATLYAWNHIAVVRSGSTITMYLNGSSVGTATSSATLGIQTLSINSPQTFANYIQTGYFSNFRIVVGTAVYTGNFTVPTSPLRTTQSAGTNISAITDESQVRLLTCQDYGEFTDNSPYNWFINTLPVVLTTSDRELPATSVFNPFDSTKQNPVLTDNYYSNLFNGTSQYLTTNAPGLTSENFTIECWFRLTSNLTFLSPDSIYLATIIGSSVTNGMYVYMRGEGTSNNVPTIIGLDALGADATGASVSVSGLSIPINTWHHLAISRTGSTYAIWFNGVKQSVTIARAGNNYAAGVYSIGYNASAATYRYWFPGYISNLRIVKGYASYNPSGGNITVPTSPLTAIGGTYLLTCQSPVAQDNTTTPFTITATGATTDKLNPFRIVNEYSVSFNGATQYLSNPTNNTALAMGAGDFTIEFWMRATSTATSILYDSRINTGTATGGFQIAIISGTIGVYGGAATGTTLCTSVSISTNRWYHVAVVRNGSGTGNVKLYIDGFLSSTYGSADTANYSQGYLNIGCYLLGGSPSLYFSGYISNWRMVKGTAVYTSNFTPPTQSLTAISGTSLLTCTSSQIRDYSDNRFAITNNGTATVSSTIYPPFTTTSTSQPEFPVSKLTSGGSLMTNNHLDDYSIFSRTYATYFNGTSASGNYLTTPSNPVFSFGLGDFTLEAWIWYFPLVGNTFGKMILDGRPAATNGPYVNFGLDNTGKIGISLGSNYYASSSALATRTWIHVAATRRNGTVRVFVNGAIVATGTGNTDAITSGGYYIGQNAFMANDTYFNGYISNARIVRGLAVYTDTFTPPTSPLTNIRGLGYDTSLLALQSSSPTVENSSNALTLTAFNGPLTTTNIPTRFYNGFFNGTNQYMTVPSDAAFSFGTGDFTVECWLWTPAFTNTYGRVIVDARPTGTNGVYWNFGLGTDGKPGLNLTNGGTVYTSSVSVADSKWHHVAVTRQSGTIRMFVDGVSVLTPVSGAETTGSGGLRIGFNSFGTVGGFAAETLWNGHLSNLRIVKGTAVYTAGFTPPTRQLTAIAGTSLLALQTATVTKDNSINNFTITNINSTTAIAPISWPTVQKQYTTGVTEVAGLLDDYTKTGAVSSYFIGDGYYLSTPSNASFSFGTGDFTLEAWVYPINGGRAADALKYGTIISQFLAGSTGAGSNSWGLGIGMNGGVFSSITLEADGGSRLNITGLTFALKTWYHVAVVRNSGTLTAYVNGTSVGSSSYASAINNNSSGSVQIGRSAYATSYNNWLNGYLSNVRVTKGIAVYTGAFTPSTMPLQTTQPAGTNIAAITSASSVSLLTCQDLGLTDKSLNGFTLTNTGGVTTTIKQIPF